MRVAFVHDWLDTYRGGERVLETMLELFPDAPIYTLFYDPKGMPRTITARSVFTPPGIGWLRPFRKLLLPLLPALMESFDLRAFDLVISTSSAVAKGAIPGPQAKHLCYMHSPMRYIWDQNEEYFRTLRKIPFVNIAFQVMAAKMRQWDVASLPRVDLFVANSHFVRQRIKRFYGVEAQVIHPPVHTSRFAPTSAKENFYLVAGAFVPYKRFDLAIDACEMLGKRLIVAGSGPELKRLKECAGKKTEFIGNPSNEEMASLMARAKGLLFPGVEDFGLIPIEAMASGTPVIALKKGGALDYITPGVTGIFFEEPTADSLAEAIARFEDMKFREDDLTGAAQKFDKQVFLKHFVDVLQQVVK